jgi:hypothetical protein
MKYNLLTLKELKNIAKNKNLSNYSNLNKDKLISLLQSKIGGNGELFKFNSETISIKLFGSNYDDYIIRTTQSNNNSSDIKKIRITVDIQHLRVTEGVIEEQINFDFNRLFDFFDFCKRFKLDKDNSEKIIFTKSDKRNELIDFINNLKKGIASTLYTMV